MHAAPVAPLPYAQVHTFAWQEVPATPPVQWKPVSQEVHLMRWLLLQAAPEAGPPLEHEHVFAVHVLPVL